MNIDDVIFLSVQEGELDKTYSEVKQLFKNKLIYIWVPEDEEEEIKSYSTQLSSLLEQNGAYNLYFEDGSIFSTNNLNSYPEFFGYA